MNDSAAVPPDIPSPCIKVCTLDPEGVCTGCHRTRREIGEWPAASRIRKIEIRRLAELRRGLASRRRGS